MCRDGSGSINLQCRLIGGGCFNLQVLVGWVCIAMLEHAIWLASTVPIVGVVILGMIGFVVRTQHGMKGDVSKHKTYHR